jgi:hypothetical protein
MPPHIPLLEGIEPDDVIVIKRSDSSESALAVDPVDSAKQVQPSVASTSRQSGQYTVEEVARHNKKDDAWLIYNDKVLDVSKWVSNYFAYTPPPHFIFSMGFPHPRTNLFTPKTTAIPPPRRRTNHPTLRRHGRNR